MATKFQIKRTSVSGRTPNTTNSANSSYIAAGELALNLTDKKMYSSNGTNYFEIGAFNVQLVNSTSNVSTYTQISTLQFDEDSGFDITNPSTGIAKVAMNSTFKYWQVDGVQKLTATGLDTVNFIAGNNITITANGANTPQSIAFSTSLTPTFTSATFGNSTVNTVANSTSITTKQIYANGIFGSNGQILTSNGTGIYWGSSAERDPQVINNLFVANGSNTQFTLTASSNTLNTFVTLNGVTQRPTTDYTVSGTTLTFTTAPALNDNISVTIVDIPNLLNVEFAQDRFTGNGSNTQYTLSTTVTGNTFTFVSVGGVTQVPTTDYSISGATLTFTTAPALNDQVEVISVDPIDDFVATAYVANGTATSFGLPHNSSTGSTFVFLNGVSQSPFADFYVSSNTVIFTAAPAANDVILIRSFYKPLSASGPNTSILYNKSGLIGGTLGFTFNESTNNVTIGNTLITPNFTLSASNPPANSTATGSTGTFAWDSSYFYIATGTNTWKKVPITTDGVVGSAVTAGSNTEIQFNDSGALGANSNFTFNKASGLLTVGNSTVNTTVNSSAIVATKIIANGAFGSNGQVLTSNGTAMYWSVGGGAGSGVGITRESFTGNGSNTIFTLSTEPIDETHLMVYVDRVIQRDADYNVSGTTLSFVVAPDNGAEIDAYIMTDSSQQPKGVKVNSFTGNGSNTQFTLGAASSNSAYTLVFVDTIFQPTSEYTISGTLITFNSAPDNAVPIEVIQLGTGLINDPQVAGSNNEIQYHYSNGFAANNKFTFNPSTTTLAVGSNLTINTSAIFIGNSTVNTTIIAGNVDLQGTQLRVGNVVVNGGQLTIGNVTITDTQITVGNSTVNTVLGSTGSLSGNGSQLTSVNAIALQGNSVNDILLAANTAANTLASAAFSNAATRADSAYSNATTYASNADNISSGTLNTARLPATVNVSTTINVGANVNINTSTIFIGNSTVNTTIAAGNINLQGTQLTVGNVTVTGDSYTIGNSTVNTTISGGSITINGVNVNTAITSNAATAYSNATSYADTKAGQAFTNAASRADSAYSNAVAYAASNTYVNTTFLPFTGGTLTGNLTVNATANIVSNLSANNVTFRGDVQIDGNLTVSGTSVVINATSLAVEDNMIYLNNGSQVSHPDLGFAGNYNDGSYKHAGFFRDATDGVWKVFDGYTPEPDASAYIDTSNASFRIAHFTANAITGNTFTGNGAALTSINATSISSGTLDTARLPATANITTAVNVGANSFVNTTTHFVGNSTVNTNISAATILINGVNVNTAITSNAATAYSNAIAYSGNAALAYANAVAYAASNSYVNSTFLPLAGGTLTGTLTVKAISSNGSVGTAGQLLASNGTSTYWIDPPASTNVNAQYTWTNTHTFSNTITFGNSTVNTAISGATITINGTNVNTAITSNAATAYTNATSFASSADNISSGTLNTARLPATVNVATILNVGANSFVNTSTHFVGNSTVNTNISAATILINGVNVNTAITSNAATAYTNATSFASNAGNLSSGTVAFARLPALYLGTTAIQSTSAAQAVSGITTLAAGNTTITGFVTASNFSDATGTYNVNLGSGGSEGRGLVAGYSGGSYGGIGYNVRHTTSGATWIAPGSDTSTYLLFTAGGFSFLGAGAGSAGRTLSYTTLATLNSSGAFNTAGAITQNGNQVLHAGNYTSYSPSLTGSGASGSWGINVTGSSGSTPTLTLTSLNTATVNVNNASTAVYRNENGSGAAIAYAPVLHLGGGDTMWQMQGSYGTSGNGTLYFRQGYSGSWGNWLTMLSSANYNSYSPTLSGTGASGTWGISITGNAGTAGGLSVHAGTNNEANKIVRTDGNGYIIAGYLNSAAGNEGNNSNPARVWGTNGSDSYLRSYLTSALSVSSAVTAGTVTTAAQPNITSVGTLTSLTVSGTVTAGTFTETSSIALKENINPITNALDIIQQLAGVTYDRKDGSKKNEAGLVAEEVEKVLPNLIGYDEYGKPIGIHYTKLTAYLIEAVKELTDKIKRLENK